MFAPAWRDRTVEDDPGADFFNQTEKFVVGANAPAEEWNNTTRLGAYDPDAIRRLKQEREGVIYMSGSGQLVRALLAEGLVDDLHLFVYPVALGAGERFFKDGEEHQLALQRHARLRQRRRPPGLRPGCERLIRRPVECWVVASSHFGTRPT